MNPVQKVEALLRRYLAAANLADRQGIIACFEPDAVHYFPAGIPGAPWRTAEHIADCLVRAVETMDARWSIEKILVGADGREAVMEWSYWKKAAGESLRGDEWYVFNDDATKIREVRAYYASPVNRAESVNELGGFDYAGRGYDIRPPYLPGRDD